MNDPSHIITLIGCGNMGSAMLGRWLGNGSGESFHIITPSPIDAAFAKHPNITQSRTPDQRINNSKLIILATKPHIIPQVAKDIEPFIAPNTPLLSIAAGLTTQTLGALFGESAPIIRAMPNTPCAAGKGASVAYASPNTPPEIKHMLTGLLTHLGTLEWTEDETIFDTVTALSGSGPAYIFYMIDVLANAAIKSGLPEPLARSLARQTLIGAAALAETSSETPQTLRENVTSKGGTTEAALNILMNGDMQEIFDQAIKAAKDRAGELNK